MVSLFVKRLGKKKGFTLVELMIVVAVIGILAAVLIPSALNMKKSAKVAGVDTNIRSVQATIESMIDGYSAKDKFATALAAKLGTSIKNPINSSNSSSTSATFPAEATESAVLVYNPAVALPTKADADLVLSTEAATVFNMPGAVVVVPWGTDTTLSGVTIYGIDADGKTMTSVEKADSYTIKK
ncbi:type II secretion system protein [Pseudobacteroides cellulosolvens]|uniref:Prepilin-type N-terminal cleavage/methylation domain-containing protein n=1 Tax=Pseudobacteroides cellulosolvens ATCC 35603 = DSM 2933 TaxID=398512 RepID=A0A0L6JKB7_9FIRM|nr:type II secretion system protein [Pseudobacteroides cellulosolvens]KNY25817.1 hypothetical protein Bccel_1077 [Pseudobacteroides cellulosolvens ATCC 35603 = DSM 2933]